MASVRSGNAESVAVIPFDMNWEFNVVLTAALIAVLSATGLVACSEKPQRVVREDDAVHSEAWSGQLRDRTRKQGESDRMNY